MNTQLRTEQTYESWYTHALGALVLLVFLLMNLSACSSNSSTNVANTNNAAATSNTPAAVTPAPKSTPSTAGESVPKALADAGEYGENVYDTAKANDWKKADAKLASLKEAAKQVRAEIKDQGATEDRLDANVTTLDRAVTAKDRPSAMRAANQVTLNVADMTAAYKLTVPVEVTKLDYYGRELEIWAEAKDAGKLRATALEMRRTWDALRPSIEARNAAEAKKFGDLVARVEAAQTPADYARLATPILDDVDNLEKVFSN